MVRRQLTRQRRGWGELASPSRLDEIKPIKQTSWYFQLRSTIVILVPPLCAGRHTDVRGVRQVKPTSPTMTLAVQNRTVPSLLLSLLPRPRQLLARLVRGVPIDPWMANFASPGEVPAAVPRVNWLRPTVGRHYALTASRSKGDPEEVTVTLTPIVARRRVGTAREPSERIRGRALRDTATQCRRPADPQAPASASMSSRCLNCFLSETEDLSRGSNGDT